MKIINSLLNSDRLPLILDEDVCFNIDSVGNIIKLIYQPFFRETTQKMMMSIFENVESLPFSFLYAPKSVLDDDDNKKIALLLKLASIEHDYKHKMEESFVVNAHIEARVELVDIKKNKEHYYTASYQEYRNIKIDNPVAKAKVIDLIDKTQKNQHIYDYGSYILYDDATTDSLENYVQNFVFGLMGSGCLNGMAQLGDASRASNYLRIIDPLEMIELAYKDSCKAIDKLKEKVVKWHKNPYLVPVSDQELPVVEIDNQSYISLLDFSQSLTIDSKQTIIRELELYQVNNNYLDRLQFVAVPKYTQINNSSDYSLYTGILVNITKNEITNFKDDTQLLEITPQKIVVFHQLNRSVNSIITARVFEIDREMKYKQEKKDFVKHKKLFNITVKEETEKLLHYFSEFDREEYFSLLLRSLCFKHYYSEDKSYEIIYYYLMSILESPSSINFQLSDTDYQSMSSRLKFITKLEISAKHNKNNQEKKHPPIQNLKKVPANYYPCTFAFAELNLTDYFSLNQCYIGTFEEIEAVIDKKNINNLQIVIIDHNVNLGVQGNICPRLVDDWQLTCRKRVIIKDMVCVDGILYAKTEVIEEKLSIKDLSRAVKLYQEVVDIFRKQQDATHNKAGIYDPDLAMLSEEDYISNASYVMMNDLGIPLWPVKNIFERLELIKSALEKLESETNNESEEDDDDYDDPDENEEGNDDSDYDEDEDSEDDGEEGDDTENTDNDDQENESENNNVAANNVSHAGEHNALSTTSTISENIKKFQKQISTLPLSIQAKKLAEEKIHAVSNNIGDSSEHIEYLKTLFDLPWGKYASNQFDLQKISQILDKEHFGLDKVKDKILESLVFSKRTDDSKLPILCLVGSPGVGKTSIAHKIAEALSRPCVSLPLGGISDSNTIRGIMQFYRGATPGKILSLIKLAESWSPVMILDEIDKIDSRNKSSIEGALLALLDPAQNDKFCDEYFDIPFDLSKVFFIATANSIDDISYPLLNRMEIIRLDGYSDNEKLLIAKNHLLPKIRKQAGASKTEIEITDEVIIDIIKNYTRESGVRELDRLLKSLIQKYLLAKEFGKKPNLNMELIESYFADKKQDLVNLSQEPIVGMVNGLAWTAMGGDLLKIEARVISGSGKIKATGSLGKSLQESIDAAYSCVVGDLSMRGIKLLDTKNSDIHVHLPSGATPKDGASAGITIYTALLSIITERAVSQQIAMTGEITLRGQVLAIGGLKEKLSAAVRDNVKTVIIPAANKKDLAKIPAEITDHLEIKTISTSLELLEMLLDKYTEMKSTNAIS